MDFKKSFKSHGSHKKNKGAKCNNPEKLPILQDHYQDQDQDQDQDRPDDLLIMPVDHPKPETSSDDHKPTIWRGSSYEFWPDVETTGQDTNNNDDLDPTVMNRTSGGGERPSFDFPQPSGLNEEDPPTRMIGEFGQIQERVKNNNGEIALDMDLEMDKLSHNAANPTATLTPTTASTPTGRNSGTATPFNSSQGPDTSRELRVSFDVPQSGSNMGASGSRLSSSSSSSASSTALTNLEQRDDGVVKCSSNMSFQRRSELLSRVKTRSRLLDPTPEEQQQFSGWIGKSGQLRSGMISKPLDEDDDDPFADEDVPEEYKRGNVNALTVLQWMSLIIIIAALACTLSIPLLKKVTLWNLYIWKWEVFLLVLICGRLVSGWGIRIVVFFIERNFLLRKRVLYFVYGLRKAVQNCIWLGLVLLAWHFMIDKRKEKETKSVVLPYVTKVLICLLVGTILWLIKTMMVKVLASSFHVSTYFDRIQDSLFNQFVIETLSGPPVIETNRLREEEERAQEEISKMQNAGANVPPDLCAAAFPPAKSGRIMGNPKLSPMISRARTDDGITIDQLHKMNNKNISAWNMKRLMKIVRNGSLTTLDEQMPDNPYEDESTRQIRSENEAKAASRKIFRNVARPGARHIHLEDLMRFLREDEAIKTMSLFEGATESKRITKSALKNWLVNAFRERRALALTLNDTKTAVNKLHQMVNFVAGTIIAVIWILILEIASSKFLVFVSSQIVLLAFIFGNTAKTIFESIIFLFFVHPYDVGDRCEIDTTQMVVEEMNILTTVFLRYDNLKILYPNSLLWQKSISNFYRSPDMCDVIEFCVHIATPVEKIAAIKQRILSYIESKPEFWSPSPATMVIVKDVEYLNMVRLAIWPMHKMNFQDVVERWTRREILVEEVIKILKEIDLQYLLYPVDINVKTMPPVVSTRVPPGWS